MSHTFRCDNCDKVIMEESSRVGWDFPVEIRGYALGLGGRKVFCGVPCAIALLDRGWIRIRDIDHNTKHETGTMAP